MPSAYQAGLAYLQILPSLAGFPEALESQLKGINPEIKVKVRPDLDTAGVDLAAGEGGESAGKKYSDAFAQIVRARIRAALEALPAINPDVDMTQAQAAFADLRAELEDLNGQKIGVDIDPADALIALASIRDRLREIEFDANSPIDVRVDATTASAELDNLLAKVKELDHFKSTIDVALNPADYALAEAQLEKLKRDANDNSGSELATAAGGGGGGFGSGGGRLGYLAAIGAVGGTLGGGAISSAALLALPAAFTALGIEAEKSTAEGKKDIADLGATAKSVTQAAFTPMIGTFENLEKSAQSTLTGLKIPLTEAAAATDPLIEKLGTGLEAAVQSGVSDSIPILNRMGPVATALAGGFTQLEKGVTGFLGQLNTGTAGKSLTGLFSVIQQLLPALADLLNAVSPLGTALAGTLGSAIKSTANALQFLSPALNVVAAALSTVSGFIGAQVPAILTFLLTVRLLTGSWTNFSGAMEKSASIMNGFLGLFNTQSTQFAKLASLVGITTAAENTRAQDLALSSQLVADAAANDALLAKARAQVTANTAEATAAEAAQAAVLDKSTEAQALSEATALEAAAARRELALADIALIEADEAAATAEEALAETTDVMTFSIAPILGIIGAVGVALGLFATQNHSSAASAKDVSQQLIQLGGSVQGVNSSISGSSSDLQKYSKDLNAIGQTASTFSAAFSGGLQPAQDYVNNLTAAQEKLGKATITTTQTFQTFDAQGNETGNRTETFTETVKQLTGEVNDNAAAYAALTPQQKAQVDAYNAFNDIIPQAKNALAGTKAEVAANTAALAQQGVVLNSTQTSWNNLGNTLATNTKNFNTATAGVKAFVDADVSVQSAFFSAQSNFKSLDQAVTQAGAAVTQAQSGVANASHGVATASQGVVDAQHQEAQSAQGVLAAQQQLQQARQQEVAAQQQVTQAQQQGRQAQLALTQAKVEAAQVIADLNRQVTDQGDTEDDARVRLVQAQQAVNQAKLQNVTLASLGAPNSKNLAEYQLLLTLQEAQHSLNDTLAQSTTLKNQQRATDAAGINGSTQVVSATQAIAQAQQQLQQATQGATQAKQGVATASQGVSDAAYQEKQAHIQVQEASYQETQAQQSLAQAKATLSQAIDSKKTATDNDTRSTSLNTQQGTANFQTVEQLFEDNLTLYGNVGEATKATVAQGAAMEITAGQVNNVIDAVTGLNGKSAVFGVVGQPSINLSELIKAATSAGLDPKELGFSAQAIGAANHVAPQVRGPGGSVIGPTHASGGLIEGPGTGTSDSILAAGNAGVHRISNGEFVVNAQSTAANLPLLHAINGSPGHAAGGLIDSADAQAITKSNIDLGIAGTIFQATRSAMNIAGYPTAGLSSLPHSNPADALVLGNSLNAVPVGVGGQIAFSPSAGVSQWAPQILATLAMLGQPASWLSTVERRMNQESGGNPNAINLWDSNAQAGHPSQGLMQTIPGTFAAYRNPSLSPNILDPEANIYAGENYAIHRYGSLAGMNRPGGYDEGGFLPPGLQMVYNATGKPEPVFNGQQWDSIHKGGLGSGGEMKISGAIQVNGLDGYIDGRIEAADSATSQLISAGTR